MILFIIFTLIYDAIFLYISLDAWPKKLRLKWPKAKSILGLGLVNFRPVKRVKLI